MYDHLCEPMGWSYITGSSVECTNMYFVKIKKIYIIFLIVSWVVGFIQIEMHPPPPHVGISQI